MHQQFLVGCFPPFCWLIEIKVIHGDMLTFILFYYYFFHWEANKLTQEQSVLDFVSSVSN